MTLLVRTHRLVRIDLYVSTCTYVERRATPTSRSIFISTCGPKRVWGGLVGGLKTVLLSSAWRRSRSRGFPRGKDQHKNAHAVPLLTSARSRDSGSRQQLRRPMGPILLAGIRWPWSPIMPPHRLNPCRPLSKGPSSPTAIVRKGHQKTPALYAFTEYRGRPRFDAGEKKPLSMAAFCISVWSWSKKYPRSPDL